VRSGAPACEKALEKGQAKLIVLADDARDEVKLAFGTRAHSKGIKIVTVPSKTALGNAIGKSPRAVLIVTDRGLAQKLWSISQETGGGISV
jgi:ribosomal protein L7Ae-like RNA K-turn-binding protein